MDKLDQSFNNTNNYGFSNQKNDAGAYDDVPQEVEEYKDSYTKADGGSYSRHQDHHLRNKSSIDIFIFYSRPRKGGNQRNMYKSSLSLNFLVMYRMDKHAA